MARLRAFAKDRRGNVALIFALAIFALGMMLAVSIDLTRASSSKTHLQDSTDAAVLAAAKAYHFNATKPAAERLAAAKAAADAYMQAMVTPRAATLLNPTWEVTVSEKGVVTLTANGSSPAYLGGLVGIDKIDFTTVAVAQGAAPRLEIALVLDNTGSMGQNDKIGKLREAALNLVASLEKGAAGSSLADPLKISLVPFSMTVRVDADAYKNAAWMDTKGLASIHHEHFSNKSKTRFQLFDQMGEPWAGCVERRPAKIGGAWVDYDVTEAPPTQGSPDTLYVPYFAPDEPGDPGADEFNGHRVNNSYLEDGVTGGWKKRQRNIAKYDKKPKHGGPNQGCTLAPLARLTAETSDIKQTIKDMVAVGNTDVAFGLMWGWHTLSPNAPFRDGRPYDEKNLTKIVILMSDGDNVNSEASNPNESTYSSAGYITTGRLGITGGSGGERTKAMDARLAKLCANMKAQKIELYTMRVEVKGSGSTVLQNCASSPSHYFEVAKAADMNAAFEQIAAAIMELHLSK